jgi:hypothetical protein
MATLAVPLAWATGVPFAGAATQSRMVTEQDNDENSHFGINGGNAHAAMLAHSTSRDDSVFHDNACCRCNVMQRAHECFQSKQQSHLERSHMQLL